MLRTEQIAHWIDVAAPVVERGLRPYTTTCIGRTDQLVQVVQDYSADTLRRRIIRSMDQEVASTWPGLSVEIDLRDDSTVAHVVDQIARRVAEWFGE